MGFSLLRNRAGGDARSIFRGPAGLIDLLSIIVGVILIGIAAAGVVATLFQIVPWAQDSTARQSLSAVRTAESVAFAMTHRYSNFTDLVAAKRIQDSRTLAAGTDADGTCFVGVSKSATGAIFFITDTSAGAAELTQSIDPGCVNAATLAGLVDSIGGFSGTPPGAQPPENQGVVTTLAGSGAYGFADGTGDAAQFSGPYGVAVDPSGTVYVADTYNRRIRKISPEGMATTLAGSGTYGFADGTGEVAQFGTPHGVAVDSSGIVYVADSNRIRKITPAGVVTTLAGSGTGGSADGTGAAAQFDGPIGVAVDSAGTVYVADSNRIRKITPAGVVTTMAGSTRGLADGTGSAAQFYAPRGVAVDSSGTVYVADAGNNRVRKITSAGVVTTLAGSVAAAHEGPSGVAVDSAGAVYAADKNLIRKIQ